MRGSQTGIRRLKMLANKLASGLYPVVMRRRASGMTTPATINITPSLFCLVTSSKSPEVPNLRLPAVLAYQFDETTPAVVLFPIPVFAFFDV